ncbi:MAG: transglutaminase domain-containing protein [Bacteroidota bacterium]|nr:transglutaminase domain-containing protein [Bacteroidota bacterium]
MSLKAQENPEFEKHAYNYESMMVTAFQKRDTAQYKRSLDHLTMDFSSLNEESQNIYKVIFSNLNYSFACLYSILNNKTKALEYLEKSKFTDYRQMLVDEDLKNIRKEKRFKTCLKYARENAPDYLNTLKKAAKYEGSGKEEHIKFTYQSKDNPNLQLLRKTYQLDSIAGMGNEISQIINISNWVHNLIHHDGYKGNPDQLNALNMIQLCKNGKRTLTCYGLSVVLNECYLSLGFKSRYVRCLPKDSTDNDCHVIVTVYSMTLKKWLWIDPTFDTYVMNEKGELLGIQEVRERLITGKPLIINPNANWNHKQSESKEAYLDYMTKNLYRLESPLNSEFDYGTKIKGKEIKYLDLDPIDYKKLESAQKNFEENLCFIHTFITHNPNIFWAIPE